VPVKLRRLAAVLAAVLALAGLAGCRTNIGTAAVVDGHRITESDVSQYVTPQSQPVNEQGQTGQSQQVSPRSFVLAQLINERFGFKILAAIPQFSRLTTAQVDAQLQRDLAGQSVQSVAESLGLHGYPTDFYQIVMRVQEISRVLSNAQQNGVDVRKVIDSLHFPVSVAPRYGTWDQSQPGFNAGAAVPGYLEVQPGPADGLQAPQNPTG
jgi:hypothetical protein